MPQPGPPACIGHMVTPSPVCEFKSFPNYFLYMLGASTLLLLVFVSLCHLFRHSRLQSAIQSPPLQPEYEGMSPWMPSLSHGRVFFLFFLKINTLIYMCVSFSTEPSCWPEVHLALWMDLFPDPLYQSQKRPCWPELSLLL